KKMAGTAGKINGHDLLLYVGGVAISHSTSCSITLNAGTVNVTSKDSDKWADFLPGAREWSVEASGMVALDATYGLDEFYTLMNSQASATVKFATSNSDDRFFSGTGYITSVSADAPDESPSTFTVSFAGTGKLKFAKT
ncbi:MAG: phage tail protein, partial [Bacteroidales bacterium]|nr:phage tail protein [Bacteroidales bacterium]